VFEVAERFLLSGSINVLKHTMPVSRAKLVSDGPESLMVTGPQLRNDALLNSSGSNNSGDADELFDDAVQAGSDLSVKETGLEEVVKPEEEHGDAALAVSEESEIQPAAAADVVPDPQLSGSDAPNSCDIAATSASSTDSSCTVPAELMAKSSDAVSNQHDSDGKEVDELHHSEDRSLNLTTDEEETTDRIQLDAAKPSVDQDDVVELPSEKDAAVGHYEEPDDLSTDEQTFDLLDTSTTETITAEPSLDTNITVVDDDSDKNEETLSAEEAAITVLISGIPCGLDETVEMYLESQKKGGGKILSFEYNKRNGSALVVFADNRGDLFSCFLLSQLSV